MSGPTLGGARLPLRSIYVKIFLWFCLTAAVSSGLVFAVAGLTGSQPFGRRYVAVTQDLYARTAVDLYSAGGAAALERYLAALERSSGMEGHLLDASNTAADILGRPLPPQDQRVLRTSMATGQSTSHFDRHFWTAASPVVSAGGAHYIFVLSSLPLRGFFGGAFFHLVAPRLGGGLLLVAVFCLLLARHITQPIRILQTAATRMASGDLSVRTRPQLRGRRDELAGMAAAFDSMAERIEGLLQNQRQMLADVSHELRSPLTRIAVSLELLRRGETDVLEPMQADLDRLNLLIGQVLELARLDLQPPSSSHRPVDLRSVLEDVAETAGYEGRGSECRVRLSMPVDCPVAAEEAALRSCFENIVRNALHHSPPGGTIEIVATRDNDSISVRVDDAGPGVPPQHLEEIFAPFFRVPGSAESHPGGSGLGLSISARIAAGCGGSISAANRRPHGLSVTVRLPCAGAPPA